MCLDEILNKSGSFEQEPLRFLNDSTKPLYRRIDAFQDAVNELAASGLGISPIVPKKDNQYNDKSPKKQNKVKNNYESENFNYTSTPIKRNNKVKNNYESENFHYTSTPIRRNKNTPQNHHMKKRDDQYNDKYPKKQIKFKNINESKYSIPIKRNKSPKKSPIKSDELNISTTPGWSKSSIVQNNNPEDYNKNILKAIKDAFNDSTPSDYGKSPIVQNNTPEDYNKNILKAIQDAFNDSTPSDYGKSPIVQITFDQEDIENVDESRQEVLKLDNVLKKLDGLTSVQKKDAIVRRIEKMKQILKNEKCSINKSFLHDYCALQKSINEIRLEYYENHKFDPNEPTIHWSYFDTESTFDGDN